jgi:hypothetical protein
VGGGTPAPAPVAAAPAPQDSWPWGSQEASIPTAFHPIPKKEQPAGYAPQAPVAPPAYHTPEPVSYAPQAPVTPPVYQTAAPAAPAVYAQEAEEYAKDIEFNWNNQGFTKPTPAAPSVDLKWDAQAQAAAQVETISQAARIKEEEQREARRVEEAKSIFMDDAFNLRTDAQREAQYETAKSNEEFQELLDEQFEKIQEKQTAIDMNREPAVAQGIAPQEPAPSSLVRGEQALASVDDRIAAFLARADREMLESIEKQVQAKREEFDSELVSPPPAYEAPAVAAEPVAETPAYAAPETPAVPQAEETWPEQPAFDASAKRAEDFFGEDVESAAAAPFTPDDLASDAAEIPVAPTPAGPVGPSFVTGAIGPQIAIQKAAEEAAARAQEPETVAAPVIEEAPVAAEAPQAPAWEAPAAAPQAPAIDPDTPGGTSAFGPAAVAAAVGAPIAAAGIAAAVTKHEPDEEWDFMKAASASYSYPMPEAPAADAVPEPVIETMPDSATAWEMPVQTPEVPEAPAFVQPEAAAPVGPAMQAAVGPAWEAPAQVFEPPVAPEVPEAPAAPAAPDYFTAPEAPAQILQQGMPGISPDYVPDAVAIPTSINAQVEEPAAAPLPQEPAMPDAQMVFIPPVAPKVEEFSVTPPAEEDPFERIGEELPDKDAPILPYDKKNHPVKAPDIIHQPVVFPFDNDEEVKDLLEPQPLPEEEESLETVVAARGKKAAKKEKEGKEKKEKAPKKKERSGGIIITIIIDILIVLAVLLLACFAILKFAPDSSIGKLISKGATSFIGLVGLDKTDADSTGEGGSTTGGGILEPNTDKVSLVRGQQYNDRSGNIEILEYDASAAYDPEVVYPLDGAADSQTIKNNYWTEDAQGPILYDETVVGAVIRFNSLLCDYINNGNGEVLADIAAGSPAETLVAETIGMLQAYEIEVLGIGDIRRTDDAFFVWTCEKVVETQANQPVERLVYKVYKLVPSGTNMQIADYAVIG